MQNKHDTSNTIFLDRFLASCDTVSAMKHTNKQGDANMNQIILINGRELWEAKHVGPNAASIIRLFGTDTIPTPFSNHVDSDTVRAKIQSLNPDVFVTVA